MKSDNLKIEIEKQISKLKVKKGSTLYVAGNLYNFSIDKANISNFCKHLLISLKKKIGNQGNIIVPTSTLNLTNTNKIYDPKKTKSYLMGIFSEYVRNQKNSFRSNHPLWSFSGVGKNVKKVLGNTSHSAYGDGSVFYNLLSFDTYFISLGEPNASIGMVHYVENLIGVPYRYNKEVFVRVKEKNKIVKKYCLLGVRFKSKYIISNNNEKIINQLYKMNTFKKLKINKGNIYICKYESIISNLRKIILKNPRIWLKNDKINQKKYFKD